MDRFTTPFGFHTTADEIVLLAKAEDFGGLNEAYVTFFPADPPTRYVSKLGVELPELLVSIRMIAVLTS